MLHVFCSPKLFNGATLITLQPGLRQEDPSDEKHTTGGAQVCRVQEEELSIPGVKGALNQNEPDRLKNKSMLNTESCKLDYMT